MSARETKPLQRLKESDWDILMRRIRDKKCTPILGTETRSEEFMIRSEIARTWAQEYDFPLASTVNLARVSRYVSVKFDPEFTKEELVKRLRQAPQPNFQDANDPYRILARLPLPVYITTNYDDFMFQALKSADRDPRREICRWWNTDEVNGPASIFDQGFDPTVANPVVFHFHGVTAELESLVLTEDDYFEFLINVSRYSMVPPRIQRAMAGTSLLLLGYRLDDWDFRVMFHLLASHLKISTSQTHVAVQIAPVADEAPEEQREKAQAYLDLYFQRYKNLNLRIYWGSCRDFITELDRRWRNYA